MAEATIKWFHCSACRKVGALPADTPYPARCSCSPRSWSLLPFKLPDGFEIRDIDDGRRLKIATYERDVWRAKYENAVKYMYAIHSLMYPAPIELEDGRVVVFRPKSIDPAEVLQELSDAIRAIPAQLASMSADSKVEMAERSEGERSS